MKHIPVLLQESIDALNIKVGDIILDGTLGGAGHTEEIAKRFGKQVKIIGLDLDADAIIRAEARLLPIPHDATFVVSNFQNANFVLDDMNILHVDSVLLDLGISSFQLEVAGRGFSFMKDEPLLMTMKKDPSEEDITAKDIVNTWKEETIADIIYGYGEEKYARKIAKAIVEHRKTKLFETTKDLADVVIATVGKAYGRLKINPATKTFQALRIAVNSELSSVELAIPILFDRIKSGGRMAIISFHSLEDRIVKQTFRKLIDEELAVGITKKPITPSIDELVANPRSRSSKLRVIEKK
ncbi:16S rRNA (cytosine(1402)-N(4))-methyltransferase RsmH [Candidatus Nomurabacteria bacterium]|nr:16S rRNA (cytosine(1402)-N(4))-methyltransferase RsmH [Candidatus Nomurabacteria bacterium]